MLIAYSDNDGMDLHSHAMWFTGGHMKMTTTCVITTNRIVHRRVIASSRIEACKVGDAFPTLLSLTQWYQCSQRAAYFALQRELKTRRKHFVDSTISHTYRVRSDGSPWNAPASNSSGWLSHRMLCEGEPVSAPRCQIRFSGRMVLVRRGDVRANQE